MEELNQTLKRLEDYILAQHGLDSPGYVRFNYQGEAKKGYPYQRMNHAAFVDALRATIEMLPAGPDPYRFLDVGCGIGTKVSIAHFAGFVSTGIDIKSEYVELAKDLFPECQFSIANALEFDYTGFEVVYLYVPLAERALMYELEARILSQLQSQSIIIAPRFTERLTSELSTESGPGNDLALGRLVARKGMNLKLLQKS